MEEVEPVERKTYRELPYKKKALLYKEFGKINPQNKIWFCVVLFACACCVTGTVLQAIYLYGKTKDEIYSVLHICFQAFWLIVWAIHIVVMQKRIRKFFDWLKTTKNIVKKAEKTKPID